MKTIKLFVIVLIGIAFVITASCAKSGAVEIGKTAPDFVLKDMDGKEVRLSDYKGKVVVLNFFASWCPPCRHEVPDFIELQKLYGDKGVSFIGVALEDAGNAKNFKERFGINYPVLVDDGKASNIYGPIRSIPTTFIIDKNMKIVKFYIGSRSKDVFENDIKELLK